MFANNSECRCLGLVNEVGVEDVKFVTLYHFRGGVVVVIMCLIVLVPLISHLHSIKVFGFSWPIFVRPLWFRNSSDQFFCHEYLLIFTYSTCNFSFVQCLCSLRKVLID